MFLKAYRVSEDRFNATRSSVIFMKGEHRCPLSHNVIGGGAASARAFGTLLRLRTRTGSALQVVTTRRRVAATTRSWVTLTATLRIEAPVDLPYPGSEGQVGSAFSRGPPFHTHPGPNGLVRAELPHTVLQGTASQCDCQATWQILRSGSGLRFNHS